MKCSKMHLVSCVLLVNLLLAVPNHSQVSTAPQTHPSEQDDKKNGTTRSLKAVRQDRIGKHDFKAVGNVEIQDSDMLLKADQVWGNEETQDMKGEGHIYFEQGNQKIWGEHFKINLKSKLGTFYQVKGRADPGFIFEAAEVEKLGEDRYRIVDGFVTACENKVPKWSFRVKEAILRLNQNVNLKHTTFRIKRLPLFYSPYLYVPTDERQRQTGFLIPSTGNSSTRGRSVSDAFFLTLGRTADVLATMEYYSLRGIAGGLDFNARPSEHSKIFAQGFFAKDKLGQGGESAQVIADTDLQNGFRAVADIYTVSSQTFRQVYGDNFYNIARPDEVSSAYLTRNFSTYSLNVFGERRVTEFPEKAVKTRTFPSFELSGHSRQLRDTPIYLSFDLSASGMSRSDSVVLTPPMVQRFDMSPRITVPLRDFRGFSFTPSFQLHETFYSDSIQSGSPNGVSPENLVRSAFDFSGEFTGPGIERVFEVGKSRYKHVIQPELSYRYINGVNEDFNRVIRVDERDIVSDTNEVEYGITNRFFSRRPTSDGGVTTNEFLSVGITQRYFFDPTFGGALVPGQRNVFWPLNTLTAFAFEDSYRRFSPIITRVRFTPATHYEADFRMDYDQQAHSIRASSISGSTYMSFGFVALTYYTTRNLPPSQFPSNQVRATFAYGNSVRRGINAAFNLNYDFNSSTLQYSASQLAYNWDCCGVALELRQFDFAARHEKQIRFSFSLKNIGSFGNMRKQERLF